VLESFVHQSGECKFSANEVVVGSNHETSSALKKDSITFSKTSVRISETLCSHTREVRTINCLLRHWYGKLNGLWTALSLGWHRPIKPVTLYVISYTLVHMLTLSHLTLNTYFPVACIIMYLVRKYPVKSRAHRQTLGPLTHETLWPYWKFLRAVTRSFLRHFRVIASAVSFLACPQKNKLSSEWCYVLGKWVKTLTLWPPLPSICSCGQGLNRALIFNLKTAIPSLSTLQDSPLILRALMVQVSAWLRCTTPKMWHPIWFLFCPSKF
jgi:hypothetical protein